MSEKHCYDEVIIISDEEDILSSDKGIHVENLQSNEIIEISDDENEEVVVEQNTVTMTGINTAMEIANTAPEVNSSVVVNVAAEVVSTNVEDNIAREVSTGAVISHNFSRVNPYDNEDDNEYLVRMNMLYHSPYYINGLLQDIYYVKILRQIIKNIKKIKGVQNSNYSDFRRFKFQISNILKPTAHLAYRPEIWDPFIINLIWLHLKNDEVSQESWKVFNGYKPVNTLIKMAEFLDITQEHYEKQMCQRVRLSKRKKTKNKCHFCPVNYCDDECSCSE